MPASRIEQARDKVKVLLTRSPRLYDLARRPYALGRFALRRPHDADYAVFRLFPATRPGVFLDVGANAGMSALSFRIFDRTTPIVSIEPNPYHEADLRFVSRLARRHTFRMFAGGSESGVFDLFVPIYRGVPLTTEASLIRTEVTESASLRDRLGPRMDTADFTIATEPVQVHRLDDLGLETVYIKLDVQGAEFSALSGLEDTIRRCRPVILVEAPDEDVVEFLSHRGYVAFSYDRDRNVLNPGPHGRTNAVFVHTCRGLRSKRDHARQV